MGEPASVSRPEQAWMVDGACAGHTELFFAPLAERPQARVRREAKARRICAECPVEALCRLYARVHREYGLWGGESEDERRAAGFGARDHGGGSLRGLRQG